MLFLKVVRFALIFCCFCQIAYANTLSPTETTIAESVKKQQTSQLQLLKKLVDINSGTMNIAGVKHTGEIIRHELQALGFKTRWVSEPPEMHRAPTLIAERTGKQGKKLLLIGHLDTVFAASSPFKKIELHAHSAKGPGVVDDKGGVVVILTALKALHAAHALDNTSITVVLTGDEEDSGKPSHISRQPLIDVAKHSDVALDFEPAMTLDTATVGRRGIALWTIEAHGNESHSATIFQKDVGDGAIFEIARIINSLRTQLEGTKYLSFNPGLLMGGTKAAYDKKTGNGNVFGKENVVAKIAIAKGDMRFLSDEQKQTIENAMSAIVKTSLPGTHSTIAFQDGIPAMSPTENNLALLKTYSEVSVALGGEVIKPFDPGLRGAGDISHVAALVPANLAGLGPVGIGTHSVIESIELPSLPIQSARAAILIYRLTR